MTYVQFVVQHSQKLKKVGDTIGGLPSTAELRRWLHDSATPRHIKNRIYQKLLYRRHIR